MEKQRVFVVDDDDAVRRALHGILAATGYAVQTFASANEFLNAGVCDSGGCLLLDLHMPGMDGLQLQQELNVRGSRLPVIFITADRDPRVSERALGAGAVGFLQKPFDSSSLLEMIDTAFNGARA